MKTPEYYKRFLPHVQPVGDTFFITARLPHTVPVPILKELQYEKQQAMENAQKQFAKNPILQAEEVYKVHKRYFKRFDDILDQANYGYTHLKNPDIAMLVIEKFHQYDNRLYELIAFTILSNHFHLLIDRSKQRNDANYLQLDGVMKYIKGGSGFAANKLLECNGRFWQRESYDHVVRSEQEFYNIIRYIGNNPVRAGLASQWDAWGFTYVKDSYRMAFESR